MCLLLLFETHRRNNNIFVRKWERAVHSDSNTSQIGVNIHSNACFMLIQKSRFTFIHWADSNAFSSTSVCVNVRCVILVISIFYHFSLYKFLCHWSVDSLIHLFSLTYSLPLSLFLSHIHTHMFSLQRCRSVQILCYMRALYSIFVVSIKYYNNRGTFCIIVIHILNDGFKCMQGIFVIF